MSNVTKKCHWVPQSYLRHFAWDDRREKIFRFSKSHAGRDPESKPIRKVAVRHHLYVPMIDGCRDTSVESKLAEIEQIFSKNSWDCLSQIKFDLSAPSIKNTLGLIAAIMLARTPEKLEKFMGLRGELRSFISRTPFETSGLIDVPLPEFSVTMSAEDFISLSDENIKEIWSKMVVQGGGFFPTIRKMRVSGVISEKGLFITSDRPVTAVHPSLESKGIDDPESFLIFPISPRLLVVFDHRVDMGDGLYYHADDRICHLYNFMIWRNSLEYMFSPRDPDQVCEEFLQYSNG